MRALCVLQRDDKLERGIQSRAEQRTKIQTQDRAGVFFYDSRSGCLGMGAKEKKRKDKKEKNKRGGAICCNTCLCELC